MPSVSPLIDADCPDRLKVLLIEDNPADALLVEERLAEAPLGPYEVQHCVRVGDGCGALAGGRFDCVLTDLGLPDAQGLEVITELTGSAPDVPIVVLSGRDDDELALRAVEQGAEDYLPKRLADGELLARAVRHAVQRRRVRAALAASERRRQAMLDTAHEAFVAIDPMGAIRDWNRAAERIFGWTAAEVVGHALGDFVIPPAERPHHDRRVAEMAAGGGAGFLGRTRELTFVRRDGTLFPGESTVTAVPFEDERWFFAFIRDISARKLAEDDLRRSEALNRTLVAHLPGTAALLFDRDLRAVKAEGSLFEDATWQRDRFLGRTVWEALGDTAADFVPSMRAALRGESRSYEWHSPDGRRVYWMQVVPVAGDDGEIRSGLHVTHDVTERRRAERYADVQHDVTKIIASSPDVEHAVPALLQTLVDGMGCDLGIFWQHDPVRDVLRWRAGWHNSGSPAPSVGEVNAVAG